MCYTEITVLKSQWPAKPIISPLHEPGCARVVPKPLSPLPLPAGCFWGAEMGKGLVFYDFFNKVLVLVFFSWVVDCCTSNRPVWNVLRCHSQSSGKWAALQGCAGQGGAGYTGKNSQFQHQTSSKHLMCSRKEFLLLSQIAEGAGTWG